MSLQARVLNASNPEELQHILGPWEFRLSREHTLRSDDADPELLITIPFTSDVKVSSDKAALLYAPPWVRPTVL